MSKEMKKTDSTQAEPIKRLNLRRDVVRKIGVRTGVRTGAIPEPPPTSIPCGTTIPHSLTLSFPSDPTVH